MKANINAHRGSADIFENVGFWLPLRAKFLEELKSFVFNDLINQTEEDGRYVNTQESLRNNEKVKLALSFFKERLDIDCVKLDTEDYYEKLTSLSGNELQGD